MKNNNLIKENENLLTEKQSGIIYSVYVSGIIFITLLFQVIVMAIANSNKYDAGIPLNEAIAFLMKKDAYKFASFSLSSVSAIVVIFYVAIILKKPLLKVSSVNKFNAKYILLGIIIFFIMFFGLSSANETFIKLLQKYFGYTYQEVVLPTYSLTNYFLTVLFICVLPAVFEELIFRGFILNSFKNSSPFIACLINGGVFAVYHMNPAQTPYQFLTGFLFAMLAIKTGSIILPMIIHFLNNFIIVTAYYFFNGGVVFPLIIKIVLFIISMLLLIVVIYKIFKKHNTNTIKNKGSIMQFFIYSSIGIAVSLSMWVVSLL